MASKLLIEVAVVLARPAQLQRLDLIVAYQRVDLLQRLETVDLFFQLGAQLSAGVINQLAVLAVSRLEDARVTRLGGARVAFKL